MSDTTTLADRLTEPGQTTRKRLTRPNLTTVLSAALGLLVLLTAALVWQNHSWQAEQNQSTCLYLQYGYPDGDDGEPDYSADMVKQSFSDLDPADRARADLHDCDIEGR